MTKYVLRRLLLMIPTLFGVTVVAFVIMQLAPGDPLLSHGDSARGDREAARETYLAQKRALRLDKPVVLNFNGFRDFGPQVRAAAEILGRSPEAVARALSGPLGDPHDERQRFYAGLHVPDYERRLADPQQHLALAKSLVDFTSVWCEDAGTSAVAAAVAVLRDPAATDVQRHGAVHALNHMVGDPFVYTYGRNPRDEETLAVTTSWRLWREHERSARAAEAAALTAERRRKLERALKQLTAAPSRADLMEGLEQFQRSDAAFFLNKLLGESTLAEKNVAALMLRLYVGKPLKNDARLDADERQWAEVIDNWTAYYAAFRTQFEPGTIRRLCDVVADTQYAYLVKRLVTFDFGPSAIGTREPVGERIWRAVQVSAPLMLASELVIYWIAVPLGIVCAVNRNRLWDRLISLALFALYSIPTFVAAMMLLLLLCYGGVVKWFPMSGLHSPAADEFSWGVWLLDYAWHACLPVVCLSLFSLAGLAMYARGSMLEVVSEDYIRTARAKGVREPGVIWRHALRNALIPVITLFADFLPAMLGGSVLIEVLFSIPGMGRLSWASIEQKDYPTLMALIYIDAIVVLLSILLSDVLYYVADPRISIEASDEAT